MRPKHMFKFRYLTLVGRIKIFRHALRVNANDKNYVRKFLKKFFTIISQSFSKMPFTTVVLG